MQAQAAVETPPQPPRYQPPRQNVKTQCKPKRLLRLPIVTSGDSRTSPCKNSMQAQAAVETMQDSPASSIRTTARKNSMQAQAAVETLRTGSRCLLHLFQRKNSMQAQAAVETVQFLHEDIEGTD